MPANVTDASVFTDPVTVPADGDAATGGSILDSVQDLANRTRFLKNALDAYIAIKAMHASFDISGAAVRPLPLTLTETKDVGGFSVVSDAVQVPAAGRYLVSAFANMKINDAADNKTITAAVYVGGIRAFYVRAVRHSTDVTDYEFASSADFVDIATPATQRIEFINISSIGDTITVLDESKLIVTRVS